MAGSDPSCAAGPDWNAIRLAYEGKELPVSRIAEQHGVSTSAINRRCLKESWVRRSAATRSGRRKVIRAPAVRRKTLVDRLYAILDHNLELMEQRMTSGEPATAAERERDTRALGALVRTFGQVSELNETTAADAAPKSGNGSALDEREADRLRLELARRILKLREEPRAE
jgi:hypothetical protein